MSWIGYFAFDGIEIINARRTEVYARTKSWFRPAWKTDDLHLSLGEAEYTNPEVDVAPWYDPAEPASAKFYGVYPIGVTGMEDSTRSSTVVESTEEGAVPGRVRHGSRAPVFNAVLLAQDEAGADYGMRWLRRALLGDLCGPTGTANRVLGNTLTYFSSRPPLDDATSTSPVAAAIPVRRNMRRVVFNTGPQLLNRFDNLSCGGSAWNVQFSAIIGKPHEYGHDKAILAGFMDPAVANPWVPGVTQGAFTNTPTTFVDLECEPTVWAPVYDPDCPPMIAPPAPPSVPLGCFDAPDSWQRYQAAIPADNVPLWGTVVPVVTVHAPFEVRNARIRFYNDPDGTFDPNETPCDFTGDAIITYIPAGGTITMDGATEEVLMTTIEGHQRRADSLVFSTDGLPFVWPTLDCGIQHVMTVDVPADTATPVVSVSLVQKII